MFTGIIQEVGSVDVCSPMGQGVKFEFACKKIHSELNLGDSVCCNGVCLSVTEITRGGFCVFSVKKTIESTNLKKLKVRDPINMELALLPSTRMGGHYVSGHIDGTASVSKVHELSDSSKEITLKVPENLTKYCIMKGSVALNGVSLTIADIKSTELTIAVIPVTLAETNFYQVSPGSVLNLEVDIMGKYAENLLGAYMPGKDDRFRSKLSNF